MLLTPAGTTLRAAVLGAECKGSLFAISFLLTLPKCLVQTKPCASVCMHTQCLHTCVHMLTHTRTHIPVLAHSKIHFFLSVWYNTFAPQVSCFGLCTMVLRSPVTAWPSRKLYFQSTLPTSNTNIRRAGTRSSLVPSAPAAHPLLAVLPRCFLLLALRLLPILQDKVT